MIRFEDNGHNVTELSSSYVLNMDDWFFFGVMQPKYRGFGPVELLGVIRNYGLWAVDAPNRTWDKHFSHVHYIQSANVEFCMHRYLDTEYDRSKMSKKTARQYWADGYTAFIGWENYGKIGPLGRPAEIFLLTFSGVVNPDTNWLTSYGEANTKFIVQRGLTPDNYEVIVS